MRDPWWSTSGASEEGLYPTVVVRSELHGLGRRRAERLLSPSRHRRMVRGGDDGCVDGWTGSRHLVGSDTHEGSPRNGARGGGGRRAREREDGSEAGRVPPQEPIERASTHARGGLLLGHVLVEGGGRDGVRWPGCKRGGRLG